MHHRLLVLTLSLGLLAGCGAQDPRTRALAADNARILSETRALEASIAAARTEREQLHGQLLVATQRVTEKLRRRVPGQDHLYLELDINQVGDVVRGFLEGLEGAGDDGGRPYTYRLHEVRTRSHRERFFVSAASSMTLGTASCEGPTSGYLLHLDRELLKLQELDLSCNTPQGSMTLRLADRLAPLPLPLRVVRRAELVASPATRLNASALEIITPLQAAITPERLVLSATTISLRPVKP